LDTMLKKIWFGVLLCGSLGAMQQDGSYLSQLIDICDIEGVKELLLIKPDLVNVLLPRGETPLKYTWTRMEFSKKSELEPLQNLFKELVDFPLTDINKKSGGDGASVVVSMFAPCIKNCPEHYHARYEKLMLIKKSIIPLLAHPHLDLTVVNSHKMSVIDYLDEYRNVKPEYYDALMSLFINLNDHNENAWGTVFARMLDRK
jgi:hypothetical protein